MKENKASKQVLTPETAARSSGSDKKKYVKELFNRVAPRYDMMNTFISLGGTTRWRRKALGLINISQGGKFLDIGTGTGLIPIWLEKNRPDVTVDAIDVSEKMLDIARLNAKKTNFFLQDATSLEMADGTYDVVASAYVLRNIHDRQKAISEMLRVTKPGGCVMLLDSFTPKCNPVMSFLLTVWLKCLVPIIVYPFQKTSDYRYLASSIMNSEPRENVVKMLTSAGAVDTKVHELEMGTVVCITALKQ